MNKKILLLFVVCVVISLATFIYAGDTACGIGGCSPTTLTSTAGATSVINLVNTGGTLSTNTLTLTVICNTTVTCFNTTNISNFVVCNASNGMYCDANPARSYEYLNQQINHTNLTNVTQVLVHAGSLTTITIGQDTSTGNGKIVVTSNPDDDAGDDGLVIDLKTMGPLNVGTVFSSSVDDSVLYLIYEHIVHPFYIEIDRISLDGKKIVRVMRMNTGVTQTIPGSSLRPDLVEVVQSELWDGRISEVIVFNYNCDAHGENCNGAAAVGINPISGTTLYGRSYTYPGSSKLSFAGAVLADDVKMKVENNIGYNTAHVTGTLNDGIGLLGDQVVIGSISTDGVNLGNFEVFQVVGGSPFPQGASITDVTNGVPGSTNSNVAGIYTNPAGLTTLLTGQITHDGTSLANTYISTNTNVVLAPNTVPVLMGIPIISGGGSYVYAGGVLASGEDFVDVYSSTMRSRINGWVTSGNDGSSTAVEARRPVKKASKEVGPTVYASLFNQSWNGNVGTRVIVLEGSSLATAFEIYNFTVDSGDALNWKGTGGHAGDFLDYVLGGRFPEKTNSSVWLDYFNTSLDVSATNPNGTTRFTTDKQVVIQTMHPDINILNFQLDFQSFNGTFDTTLGTCVNCSYDLSNGTCQAEVEKVWGMFQKYRLNMTLTTATPGGIGMTNLTLECRTANLTVVKNANCAGLFSTYGVGTDGCVSWLGVPGRSWVIGVNAGIGIDMTGFASASFGMGNITPTATCEQIACEVTGVWQPGDDQEFVMNKTITVTAI